ncbi:hypothetical protein [Humitalea rosea]|uniref:hypothetical protein n=1 Tax=Humitalea rosea TaxID=990373 RepID=UPI001475003E|nr:hypothetical protein [Humitalea rosea]
MAEACSAANRLSTQAAGAAARIVGWLNREAREKLRAVFDRVDAEFRGLAALQHARPYGE